MKNTKNSLEAVKREIFYYLGKNVSDDEAEEIMYIKEDNPTASLDEIISDYYGCMEA